MKTLVFLSGLIAALLLTGCQSASFPTSAAAIRDGKQQTPSLAIERWTTKGGSEVLFVADHSLPMLDIQLTFAAGASRDNGVPGLAALTNSLLGEDTTNGLSSDEVFRGFESLGAQFNLGSYRDMAIISLRTLSDPEYLEPSLELFRRVLSPAFAKDDISRIRTQMLQGLKMEQQVPGPRASEAYMKAIFGDHPYAHPSDGTLKSLPNISREQLKAFYQRYYAAGNLVISLVGDISSEQAHRLAASISQALPQGPHAAELPLAETRQPQLIHLPFDSSQTHILIGNQAIYRGVPDWPSLYVGNWILGGGGFASRLMQQVREQHGYVYGIHSSLSPMAAGGPFTISLKTANDSAQKALNLTLRVLRKFIQQGPSEAEVQQAIDHISGSFPLSVASNAAIVSQLGAIGFYDLPSDYLTRFVERIRQVTPAQVKAAMQQVVSLDKLVIVSVGPKELSREALSSPDEHPQE